VLPESIPLPTHRIFGVSISRLGLTDSIRYCLERARDRKGGYVCFVNVHTVTEAHDDPALKRVLNEAALSTPDGVPLVWLSKLRGEPVETRVCGPDFMEKVLKDFPGVGHGFVGGSPGLPETIIERYKLVAPSYSPPMRPFSPESAREDWEAFRAGIPGGKPPAFVWVGLGAPKQEFWMQAVSAIAPETLFFGVGAAFDFLALKKNRAPEWMRKAGLEWFYRLSQEPNRLGRRYLKTNFAFLIYVIADLFRKPEAR
jgi:N-acetylglucosaminyldiphosphoundecaprenol N-acetyl-beta-D-mannosaminyltransferase